MLQTFSRRALLSVVALSLAAGCSGSSVTTGGSSLTPATHRVGGAVRYIPGPVVSGPIAIPLVRTKTNAPVGWPDKKKKGKSILFVADCSAGILMYDPTVANSDSSPFFQAAVDSAVRAVFQCQPYELPSDKYALWRDMILNFDPSDMYRSG